MKRICIALFAALLLLSGCGAESKAPAAQSNNGGASYMDTEKRENTGTQPDSETETDTARADEPGEDEAFDGEKYTELTESYRQLLKGDISDYFYNPSGQELSDAAELLTEKGFSVICPGGAMSAPESLERAIDGGGSAEFIELCSDGGFWYYEVTGDRSLRMIRTAWGRDGSAHVTDREEYELGNIYVTEDGNLILERIIPDNPESKSNHDGYKEPELAFRLR